MHRGWFGNHTRSRAASDEKLVLALLQASHVSKGASRAWFVAIMHSLNLAT